MAYFQYSPTRVAIRSRLESISSPISHTHCVFVTTAMSMLDGGADHRLNGATNSKRNLTRSRLPVSMHPRGELPPIEQLR